VRSRPSRRRVPPSAEVAALLAQVGAPTTAAELGFDDAERDLAIANGHYLRDRFTVRKLARVLGLAR
jgi:glycerol dehydrogenase-like iron-containing ADH family enzyme